VCDGVSHEGHPAEDWDNGEDVGSDGSVEHGEGFLSVGRCGA